jgi:hypothetical protein
MLSLTLKASSISSRPSPLIATNKYYKQIKCNGLEKAKVIFFGMKI